MKSLLIGFFVLMLGLYFSCGDKSPEPTTANINDLLGMWVSVDSNIFQDTNGVFMYNQDTLRISSDLIQVNNKKSYYSIVESKRSYYSFQYFGKDSLIVSYKGPLEIGLVNNRWPNKVLYSKNKDTLYISNWKNTFPGHLFDEFYKIIK